MSIEARKIRLIMALRRQGVTDARVLSAIEKVPRERFVPESFRDRAYDDAALPIGLGQTISQPTVVALMTQALDAGPRHKVLEVGTGSGYQAAVLAKLCRRLYTIERHKALMEHAMAILQEIGITNVTAIAGDGMKGWPEQAPFQRIIVTAAHSGRSAPAALLEQLDEDGLMVIPLTDDIGVQHIHRLRKAREGLVDDRLFPVRFVPLVGGSGQ